MVVEDRALNVSPGVVRPRTTSNTLAAVGGTLILLGVPIGLLVWFRPLASLAGWNAVMPFVVCGVVSQGVIGALAILIGARVSRNQSGGGWLFAIGVAQLPLGILIYFVSYAMLLAVSGGFLLIASGALATVGRIR